ncbi:MAG: signal peptidase II [Thermodesulforhabdaceae bacterium]
MVNLEKWKRFLPFWITGMLIFLIDQLTKHLIVAVLPLHDKLEILPGFLNLVHVRNTGVAFSLFAQLRESSLIFGVIALCAVVILHIIVVRMEQASLGEIIPLGLILGGAIGNLFDRIRTGAVIDFIDLYIGNYHWPAFNVADSAITIGAILLGMRILCSNSTSSKSKTSINQ